MDDLSDHEDDAAERRRRKQEEFAKMRRALLADEKIGKIAQNPKQQAFFLAIEDREEFNGLEYMDRPEQESVSESQVEEIMEPREAAEESDASQTSAALKRKLPHGFEEAVGKENVPPRNPRRTYPDDSSKRPTTLAEIRESLSFFLEDSIVPDSQIEQSDEEDDLDFGRPFSVTRSDTNTSNDSMSSRTSVVNRLARTDSQDSLTSKHLAFQAGSSATGPSFKVPSLLRRATNLSATSNSSTRTSNSSGSNESSVRMGGSKKSNIHYQAREAERRRVVDAADQKRKAQVKKTVMSSKGRSILGLLRKGDSGFE
jgi:mediator of replication checkpoint protein 1